MDVNKKPTSTEEIIGESVLKEMDEEEIIQS